MSNAPMDRGRERNDRDLKMARLRDPEGTVRAETAGFTECLHSMINDALEHIDNLQEYVSQVETTNDGSNMAQEAKNWLCAALALADDFNRRAQGEVSE